MKRGPLILMLSLVTVAIAFSGCRTCKLTGSGLTAYTRARSASLGPWSDAVVVINGHGFSPHQRIDISFRNLPGAFASGKSWHTDQPIAPVTDANGSFSWSISVASSSISIRSLPALDYDADANSEVSITAKEHWSPCSAETSLKAGALTHAVFAASPVDSTKK